MTGPAAPPDSAQGVGGERGSERTGRVFVVVGEVLLDRAREVEEVHPLVQVQRLVRCLLKTKNERRSARAEPPDAEAHLAQELDKSLGVRLVGHDEFEYANAHLQVWGHV